MHIAHNALADPTASRAVEFVLGQIVGQVEPLRSWPKAEKALFLTLPPAIRAIIARREAERETYLRTKQNQLIEELNKLTEKKQTDGNKTEG